jgi:folate-dependent phosphoribosylglycinamide formyltransferase PurN
MESRYHCREVQNLVDAGYEVPLILIDEETDRQWNQLTEQDLSTEDTGMLSRIVAGISLVTSFFSMILRGSFKALILAEQRIAKAVKPEATVENELAMESRKEDITETVDGLSESEVVYFNPEHVDGITYDFPSDVIDTVTEKCDVVVLLSFSRILTGDILGAPEYGVLGFHGADIRRYRGRPGGFFQWVEDEETMGLKLQRLTNDLDGGELVLCEHFDISGANCWKELKVRKMQTFDDLLVQGLERLQNPEFEPEVPELGRLTHSEDAHQPRHALKCLVKNIRNRYSG